jgi:putative membrane protein
MGRAEASAFAGNPLLLTAAIGAVGLVAWLLAAGRSDDRRMRRLSLAAAAALLAGVWFSPLATMAQRYLLSAHLLQVTILMGAVPPLLLLALPRYPRIRLPRPALAVLRLAVHPLVAIVAVNVAFFGWHTAGLFDAALQNAWLYAAMQISLLLVSLAFWWPIITPFSPPVRCMTPLGKVGYILLATIPQTFGGLVVALAHRALYPVYAAAPRLLGLDAMTDQQIAGASIALVSKIALFAAMTVIFMRLLGSTSMESDEDSGGGGGSARLDTPRPRPSGTPKWLVQINADRTVAEPAPAPRVRVPAGSGSARE